MYLDTDMTGRITCSKNIQMNYSILTYRLKLYRMSLRSVGFNEHEV